MTYVLTYGSEQIYSTTLDFFILFFWPSSWVNSGKKTQGDCFKPEDANLYKLFAILSVISINGMTRRKNWRFG